jgi:hypothetical protein
MKTINLLISITTFFIIGCKKNYVCECKTTKTQNNIQQDMPVENYGFEKLKKQQAIDSCNAKDYYLDNPNEKVVRNCTLK